MSTMASLARYHAFIPRILAPVHPLLPFGALDLFGSLRLSMVVNWAASGAFDQQPVPMQVNGDVHEKSNGVSSKKSKKTCRARAGLLQELLGISVIVFGGETFLCALSGTTPSWLIDPKLLLLFWTAHTLQTRTPLIHFLPSKPSFIPELLLSVPDGIGRALLLTRFSVVPLLRPLSATSLPATPSTLILTPFILAVPFAAIAFSGLNLFSATPKLAVPAELQPWGWTSPDFWAALVCPAMFLYLIGPVKGWAWGLGWSEEAATVLIAIFITSVFIMRTVYNLGGQSSASSSSKKIKTA
ncbi:hypothetical protein BD324DRAFT_637685 [Kockovaella imperatae]|uniref:Uncharacterized protein n=1 Tax=Kockovaella imperatae TaxID=4999 RepID=A0A1Y1U7A3_9TREE|nr:hypothetical protein BD324DRAFT_637685 [Kockovaella imperatae]ORX33909.1 hypothetical protein BD324DRAFT_637685 [Kockovaella imperatae]